MPLKKPTLIAIVDNDVSVRKALLRLLKAAGIEGKTFASGEEFVTAVNRHQYDCLILDLHMLGMTGHDVQNFCLLNKLNLKTIIITAHDEPGVRERCFSEGAMAYFCKPIDAAELLVAVEKALS